MASTVTSDRSPIAGRLPLAAAIAAASTGAVSAVIALATVPLGVPQIPQLTPVAVALFSVVASVVGAIGWQLVRRRAAEPRRTLLRLAVIVLVVSFVPDVLLGLSLAGTTGVAPVVALALMHVTTIAIAVAVFARLLPVDAAPVPSAVREGSRG